MGRSVEYRSRVGRVAYELIAEGASAVQDVPSVAGADDRARRVQHPEVL